MKRRTHNLFLVLVSILFIGGFSTSAFNGNKKVTGVFPETIEIGYEDPHCDCLLSDNLYIMDSDSGEQVYLLDNKGYLNKYYYMESERPGAEDGGEGYGGATYRLKEQYLDRTFTITYKKDLCPGYKKCNEGKIYKNIVISIK